MFVFPPNKNKKALFFVFCSVALENTYCICQRQIVLVQYVCLAVRSISECARYPSVIDSRSTLGRPKVLSSCSPRHNFAMIVRRRGSYFIFCTPPPPSALSFFCGKKRTRANYSKFTIQYSMLLLFYILVMVIASFNQSIAALDTVAVVRHATHV